MSVAFLLAVFLSPGNSLLVFDLLSSSSSSSSLSSLNLLWIFWAPNIDLPLNIKHLMTGPEGNSEFCFPRISVFPEMKSRETLRFEGNKIHCSPRDQSLSDLLYSKIKRKQILNNALRFQQQRSTFRG